MSATDLHEHAPVVLTRDLPEQGLRAGDVGTLVHIYADGDAVEVEFQSGAGTTVAVTTLERPDIRRLTDDEILHVRGIAA